MILNLKFPASTCTARFVPGLFGNHIVCFLVLRLIMLFSMMLHKQDRKQQIEQILAITKIELNKSTLSSGLTARGRF